MLYTNYFWKPFKKKSQKQVSAAVGSAYKNPVLDSQFLKISPTMQKKVIFFKKNLIFKGLNGCYSKRIYKG